MDNSTNSLLIFADGGSRNSGASHLGGKVAKNDPAAWAYLIIDNQNNFNISDSGFVPGATNNAMEITAVSKAFDQLMEKPEYSNRSFDLILDSKYVLDSLQKGWLNTWIAKKDVNRPNFRIWQELFHKFTVLEPMINYVWVKGHANSKGNIYVDQLLNQEMDNNNNKTT